MLFLLFFSCLICITLGDQLNFCVIGDWGSGKDEQKLVAAGMGQWAQKNNAAFTISVGDNFYEWGVSSATDSDFEDRWNKVYVHPALQHRWYVVAGNHDHLLNRAGNQVARSGIDKRWYFPALSYSVYRNVEQKLVHFVFWDSERGRHDSNQINWLKNELENSIGDWIFVVAHHPIVSSGQHGVDPTMYKEIRPLLEKAKVAVYFTGHDHDLEHLESPKSSLHHVISGAGGKSRGKCDSCAQEVASKGYTSTFFKNYGFVGVELIEDTVTVNYFDEKATLLKKITIKNPRTKATAAPISKSVSFHIYPNVVSTAPTVREAKNTSINECKEMCVRFASFCHGFSHRAGNCMLKNRSITEKGRVLFSPGTQTYIRSQ